MAKVYRNKLQRDQDERAAAREQRREEEQKAAAQRRQEKQEKKEQAKIEEQKRIEREMKKARRDKQKARDAYVKGREELFSELVSMSDEERAKRIEEIASERDILRKRIEGKAEKGISDPESAKRDKELELEQKRLESVPEVQKQIKRVIEIRDSFVEKKDETVKALRNEKRRNNDKISKLQKAIDEKTEQNKQTKEVAKSRVPEIEKRLQEIEAELREFDEYIDYVEQNDVDMSKEQPRIDELTAKSKTLIAEREGLVKERSNLASTKLEDEVRENEEQVKELKERNTQITQELDVYISGRSKEDSVIHKCNMAWMMLLDGKSWDEIKLKAVESLKAKSPKTEEKKPEQAPAQEPTAEPAPEQAPAQEPTAEPEPEQAPVQEPIAEPEPEQAPVQEPDLEENQGERLPVEKKLKWAERFPRFARTGPGKLIFGILDRKANDRENMEKIRAKLKNGAYDSLIMDEASDDAVIVKKEPKQLEPHIEPEQTPDPNPVPEQDKSPIKEKRDAFMDYLQEMATGEKGEGKDRFASEELTRAAEAKKAEYEKKASKEPEDEETR